MFRRSPKTGAVRRDICERNNCALGKEAGEQTKKFSKAKQLTYLPALYTPNEDLEDVVEYDAECDIYNYNRFPR